MQVTKLSVLCTPMAPKTELWPRPTLLSLNACILLSSSLLKQRHRDRPGSPPLLELGIYKPSLKHLKNYAKTVNINDSLCCLFSKSSSDVLFS